LVSLNNNKMGKVYLGHRVSIESGDDSFTFNIELKENTLVLKFENGILQFIVDDKVIMEFPS
jgi:hypothetical protein